MRNAILAGLAALPLVFGCQLDETRRRNFICLIDYSASMNGANMQRSMNVISRFVLPNLHERDRLIVLPIDGASKTVAEKIFYLDMSEKVFSLPSDGYTHARDSTKKRVLDFMTMVGGTIERGIQKHWVTRKRYSNFSDIFGALEQTASYIEHGDELKESSSNFFTALLEKGKEPDVENVVLIISDMKHESPEFTFSRPEGCPPSYARHVLSTLQDRDGIPDLTGCKIFVYGRTGRSNREVENIKRFWMKYFKEAQADVVAYDYEPDNVVTAFLNGHR